MFLGAVASSYLNATPATQGVDYASTVLADGPRLLWPFDDASGTGVRDLGANSLPGTYGTSPAPNLGQPTIVTTGANSVLCTDRMWSNAAVMRLGPNWSVEVWMKLVRAGENALMGVATANGYDNSSSYGAELFVDDNNHINLRHYVPAFGDNFVATGSVNVASGRHLLVGVLDSSAAPTFLIYVDGVLDVSSPIGGAPESGYDCFLHANYCGYSGVADIGNQYLQMAAVYDKALTAAQVAAHWNAGK